MTREITTMASERELVILRDTLHNLHFQSGSTPHYAKGLLVGVVGALMYKGMQWGDAIALCSANAPKRIIPDSVPESWLSAFGLSNDTIQNQTSELYWERSEGRV